MLSRFGKFKRKVLPPPRFPLQCVKNPGKKESTAGSFVNPSDLITQVVCLARLKEIIRLIMIVNSSRKSIRLIIVNK